MSQHQKADHNSAANFCKTWNVEVGGVSATCSWQHGRLSPLLAGKSLGREGFSGRSPTRDMEFGEQRQLEVAEGMEGGPSWQALKRRLPHRVPVVIPLSARP